MGLRLWRVASATRVTNQQINTTQGYDANLPLDTREDV